MRQVLHAAGSASAEEVWDRYVQPSRWPQWSPQIRRVSYPGPVLTAGTTGTVHGLFGLRVRFTVRSVDPAARRWSWVVRVGPIRLDLQHSVAAVGSGASTELVIDGPAAIVLGYLPVAQLALNRLVQP